MTERSRAQIRAQVEHAFRGVPRLAAEDIVLEEYRHNIDAQEMAGAFGGRFWTQLSLEELFFHRESIFMFSSAGYLSYLPAYMVGCLRDDMELVPDISTYLVSGLRSQRKRRTSQQRLELHRPVGYQEVRVVSKLPFSTAGGAVLGQASTRRGT